MAKTRSSVAASAPVVAAPAAAKHVTPAAKTARKSAVKPAAKATSKSVKPPVKAAAKAVAKPVTAVVKTPAAAPVAVKPPKTKLVRDSFTIPKDEYQVLDRLKSRALNLGQHVKKGELLRAGIQALAAMSDGTFAKAIDAVPTLKTGRPKAD